MKPAQRRINNLRAEFLKRHKEHRGRTARPWPQPTMESEPEFLAKTQRSQAAKKRRKPNLEFLRLGSFASLREKSCSKNKKLRTCITERLVSIVNANQRQTCFVIELSSQMLG